MKQVHIIVKGRVQGVFFRAATRDKAQQLDIKGYVKNLDNGDVEIVAQGTEGPLAELIGWCHHGPDIALVDKVDIKYQHPEDCFSDFHVKH